MGTKKCTKCKEEKPEDEFQLKSLWKKMRNGTVKRYPDRRVTICHSCVYWRDRGSKKFTERLKKKRAWNRPDKKLIGLSRKERDFMEILTPRLHPYIKNT